MLIIKLKMDHAQSLQNVLFASPKHSECGFAFYLVCHVMEVFAELCDLDSALFRDVDIYASGAAKLERLGFKPVTNPLCYLLFAQKLIVFPTNFKLLPAQASQIPSFLRSS